MSEYEYLVEFSGVNAGTGTAVRHAYSTHGGLALSDTVASYLVSDDFTAANGTVIEGRTPSPTQPGASTWGEVGVSASDAADVFAVSSNAMVATSGHRAALIDAGVSVVEVRATVTMSNVSALAYAGVVLRADRIPLGGINGDEVDGFVAFVRGGGGTSRIVLAIAEMVSSPVSVTEVATVEFSADELDPASAFTLTFRDTGAELIAAILEAPHISVTYDDAATYTANTYVGLYVYIPTAQTITFADFKAFALADTLAQADARLLSPISVSASLPVTGRFLGVATTTVGNITLANGDGGLDSLVDEAFRGQPITVKRGAVGTAYADMTPIFRGRIDQPVYEPSQVLLQVRRTDAALDLPLQPHTFAGTGGVEGDTDLVGKRKPMCFGVPKNVPFPLVDNSNGSGRPEYFVHDGEISAATAIYFAGAAVTSGVDYNLLTASGVSTIELLTTPAGQVTGNITGDVRSAVYVSTAADIIERMARELMLLTDAHIDAAAFAQAAIDAAGACGLWTGTDEVSRREVFDLLARSAGAFVYVNRLDQLTMRVLAAPAVSADKALTDANILSVKILAKPAALKEVRVAYQRNYQVQTETDLAGSVTNARKQYLAEAFRTAESTDATVMQKEPFAEVLHLTTALNNGTVAQTLADNTLALHSPEKLLYAVDCVGNEYDIDLGDTVEITWDRFGLDAGKNLLVVGIDERAGSDHYTLTLWG